MDIRIQEIPFCVISIASDSDAKEPMMGDNIPKEPLLRNLQECTGRWKIEKR